MKMIVGLGNPGKQYENTRHNIGFMALDRLADSYGVSWSQETKFQAKVASAMVDGEKILLVKPMTYMNESGQAVEKMSQYYKIDPDNMLIIYDDLDLPTGKLRLRQSGSAGGHNGIKSIISHLGTSNFKRIRTGIDRPDKQSVVDYVLGELRSDEQDKLSSSFDYIQSAVDLWLQSDDFNQVMNRFNQKKEE